MSAPSPSLLDDALALARVGLHVVPMHTPRGEACSCSRGEACRSAGKHPRLRDWTTEATSDEATVRRWWTRWPDANIGIATGAGSGVVVLDLDGREGVDAMRRLSAPHGGLPRTLAARTGGGGVHCFFRWDAARPLGNRVGLVPKVDFRGEGGVVIAAPSLHRSGRRYRWLLPEGKAGPSRERIAPLPDWLRKRVDGSSAKGPAPAARHPGATPTAAPASSDLCAAWLRSVAGEASAALEAAGPGERHKALFKGAARLGNHAEAVGLDAAGAGELLLGAARRCGYFASRDRAEFDRVVGDGFAAGLKQPRGIPDDFSRTHREGAPGSAAWRAGLTRDSRDRVRPSRPNLVLILEHDTRYAGRLGEDLLSGQVEWRSWPPHLPLEAERRFPSELRDQDVVLLHTLLEEEYGFALNREALWDALSVVAQHHRYHPVREYLGGLSWDGEERVDQWLSRFCAAADTPYTRAVGARWLIAAVARASKPGCKVDNVLLLEGEQGIKKSTVAEILGGRWTADGLPPLTTKDASSYLRGLWIVELAELAGLRRGEWNAIKAFLTRREDRFRPAYGRREVSRPRQCVFLGTVNDAEYLGDPTGARRFWPVRVERVDAAGLREHRDQLWAEAAHRFAAGERWWLDADLDADLIALARQEQDGRHTSDAFEPVVLDFVAGRDEVTTDEVFRFAPWPDGARPRMTPSEQSRIVAVLTRLGFRKTRPRRGGRRVAVYVRSEAGASVLRLAAGSGGTPGTAGSTGTEG